MVCEIKQRKGKRSSNRETIPDSSRVSNREEFPKAEVIIVLFRKK